MSGILVGMRLDTESVIAGMLHDVMEDTPVGKERIARDFGKEVADLVDGVTKLSPDRGRVAGRRSGRELSQDAACDDR